MFEKFDLNDRSTVITLVVAALSVAALMAFLLYMLRRRVVVQAATTVVDTVKSAADTAKSAAVNVTDNISIVMPEALGGKRQATVHHRKKKFIEHIQQLYPANWRTCEWGRDAEGRCRPKH